MSARLKEKEEKILKILEDLSRESAQGTLIIVEGKKDTETLRALGVEGKIITAKGGGRSLLDVISEVEESKTRRIILLMDCDRRGKEWTAKLKHHLEAGRIKADTRFWREIFALVGKEVRDVEGLVAYMETLKSKISDS